MKPNKNTNWAVQNIGNTSKNKCNCKSWIGHWRAATGSRRVTCSVSECSNPAQVGAHVRIIDGRTTKDWWIVPMCRAHNIHHNTKPMFIARDTEMVSASVAITCGLANWLEPD